jgi:diacylglycerol kinase (ATP)
VLIALGHGSALNAPRTFCVRLPSVGVGPDPYTPSVLPPRTVVIVNPQSQGGKLGKRWPELAETLTRAFPYDVVHTQAQGDATRLAREALRSGAQRIVAVGGDGTLNEVVNGFFENGKPIAPDASLGVIPFGTGGDFRRTVNVPKEAADAAAVIATNHRQKVDVGKLDLTSHDGKPMQRMFLNIASFGIGGHTDRLINESGKKLGRMGYFTKGVQATLSYKNQRVQMRFDGSADDRVEITTYNVAVANGRYFGGGMMIAPNAELDDGRFDVVVVGDLSFFQLLRGFARQVYSGAHLKTKGISSRRAKLVEAEAIDPNDKVEFDVDGEHLGRLPARFEIVPSSLWLIVPGPRSESGTLHSGPGPGAAGA